MSIYGYPDNLTDAEIAEAYNAAPEAWKPVPSHTFLAWLGGGARTLRIQAWAEKVKADYVKAIDLSENFDMVKLAIASGALTSFLGAPNTAVYLSLDPASEQRQLLAGLVGYGVLQSDESADLIAKAQARDPITTEDVATERARLAAQAAKDTLSNWLASRTSVAQAAINDGTATSEDELKAILSA